MNLMFIIELKNVIFTVLPGDGVFNHFHFEWFSDSRYYLCESNFKEMFVINTEALLEFFLCFIFKLLCRYQCTSWGIHC